MVLVIMDDLTFGTFKAIEPINASVGGEREGERAEENRNPQPAKFHSNAKILGISGMDSRAQLTRSCPLIGSFLMSSPIDGAGNSLR